MRERYVMKSLGIFLGVTLILWVFAGTVALLNLFFSTTVSVFGAVGVIALWTGLSKIRC